MPDPLITAVSAEDINEVTRFVMQARAGMFPMLDPDAMPADLKAFDWVYSPQNGGQFLQARIDGKLAGVIGFLAYDGRFPQLDYTARKTVEVVRLFIDPPFRRIGLAALLFNALKHQARLQQVDTLYLHTHPFLPGAIAFWQRQGFAIVHVEDDPVWQTTHMEIALSTPH